MRSARRRPLVPLDAAGVPYSFLLSVAEGGGGLAATLLREMWRVHSCHGDAASWRGTYGLVPPPPAPHGGGSGGSGGVLGSAAQASGYVGLANLGCTCYMASLMQQLFMCPCLADGLLAADADAARHGQGDMLMELQLMLATLQHSHEPWYVPSGFCGAFRDFDGLPLSPHEQRDADEFLHELLQRIEEGLGEAHPLLDALFGGALAQQVLWTDPADGATPRKSGHLEPFRVLQLDTAGCATLEEALEGYVAGELISGYDVGAADGARVEARKRCCLGRLPHTLVVQMKRFEFDYDTMVKRKVFDHCAVPERLDVAPYTDADATGAAAAPVRRRRRSRARHRGGRGRRWRAAVIAAVDALRARRRDDPHWRRRLWPLLLIHS